MMKDSKKLSISVFWNFAGMILNRGSSMLFMLVLAGILAPDSFGLIAMMAVILELGQHIVKSGFGQALIRAKEITDKDLSTSFISSLIIGITVYFIIYIAAPFFSAFYSAESLKDLLRVIAIVVFINTFKVIPIAILSREMNFRPIMMAELFGALSGGLVAIYLAYNSADVWSLVAQAIVSSFVSAVILWRVSSWKVSVVFDYESFKNLFGFGINLLLIGIVRILVENSYIVVLGRFFSAEITGLYFMAKKISHVITQQLSGAIQKSSFPLLSTYQDDNYKICVRYRVIIQVAMFVIAPVMTLMAAMSELIFSLLGEEWMGGVIYLQLLSVVALLYPIHAVNVNILKVKARTDLVLRIGLIKNALSLFFLIIMIPYGVEWIIIGQIFHSIICIIPNTYYTSRLVGYSPRQQFSDAFKPIFSALISALLINFISTFYSFEGVLGLLVLGIIGFGIYFIISWAAKVEGGTVLIDKLVAK